MLHAETLVEIDAADETALFHDLADGTFRADQQFFGKFHPLFKKKPDGRKLIEFSPFTVKSAAAETILFHQSSQVDFFVQVRCQPGSDVMDFQIDPVPFFCPRPELNQKLGSPTGRDGPPCRGGKGVSIPAVFLQ